MVDTNLALAETEDALSKTKPRYTDDENELLFESWWNHEQRQELAHRLGRDLNTLRTRFYRLLKEKGLSKQEYYRLIASRTGEGRIFPLRKTKRDLKTTDYTILQTFCRYQALGYSRTRAVQELQRILGPKYTTAALKLRFYRMVKRLQYTDADLLRIGKELLGEKITVDSQTEIPVQMEPKRESAPMSAPVGVMPEKTPAKEGSHLFFDELSALPETLHRLEERVAVIENAQRRQLDLRGFIEHLLAVERDLKKEDRLVEEIQHLLDENEKMKQTMDRERQRLKKREDELNGMYQTLERSLGDFMRLENVSKLASLGDFMNRLEITVDQFGNVLKSRRVTNEIS